MTPDQHARVALAYDRKAYRYDTHFSLYTKSVLPAVVDMLHLRGDEHMLDVACGTGELEKRMVERWPEVAVCGIDLSEEMLASARRKLAAYPKMTFAPGDAAALDYPDASFDVVVCCSAFHYMRKPDVVMREFARVLKPGGRVLIHDWCGDFLIAKLYHVIRKATIPSHYRVHTEAEMQALMREAGLTPTRAKKYKALVMWRLMIVEAIKSVA